VNATISSILSESQHWLAVIIWGDATDELLSQIWHLPRRHQVI